VHIFIRKKKKRLKLIDGSFQIFPPTQSDSTLAFTRSITAKRATVQPGTPAEQSQIGQNHKSAAKNYEDLKVDLSDPSF
jgi:hypothetical protein